MREYANLENLRKAAVFGAIIAFMSLPRLADAGMQLSTYLPATFLSMTLASAAATAWGSKYGMKGLFPQREIIKKGLISALLLGLLALPLKVYFVDPALKSSLPPKMLALSFPTTALGVAGIILWASGFENMFFNVAATSYFTRLSRNMWLAVALSASFRAFVSSRLLMAAEIESPALLAMNALSCFTACTLFAKAGWPASALFTALAAASVAFN